MPDSEAKCDENDLPIRCFYNIRELKMKISQIAMTDISDAVEELSTLTGIAPQLIIVFGCVDHFSDPVFLKH